MSLSTYNKKRNFDETSEPEGKPGKDSKEHIFVVQRHHASHLHYDFRLELAGTLKSWAVPKGPSLNPKDRRLAMMVEDHPLAYSTFEGDIPDGNYGAGHVDVWDHGTYEPVNEKGEVISFGECYKNLLAGSLKFRMHGRHLKGEFALVNMKKDKKSWLLIKHRDKFAVDEPYNSEDFAKKSSLAYTEKRNSKNNTNKESGKAKSDQDRRKKQKAVGTRELKHGKYTEFIKPMLAKLHDAAFDDPEWLFEIKWDGYRAIAEIGGDENRLYSRKGLSFATAYGAVFEALGDFKDDVIVDGELVALDKDGLPSFQLLQNEGRHGVQLCYYVFDLLFLNGASLEKKTLVERKDILKSIMPTSNIIKYCDHIIGKGKAFFKELGKNSMEGMIAKKAQSTYAEGTRSPDWLKIKHVLTDEAIIAGYTAPRGSRKYFGALVLGRYEHGKLEYIGHTGTGFTQETLEAVYKKMQPLVVDENPFGKTISVNSKVTWLQPMLVCNIKFTEITNGGMRRHPVFLGLRVDKEAVEVTGADAAKPEKEKAMAGTKKIGGNKLVFTNTDKVYWPEEGYTKGDLLAYYEGISKYILKYLKDRPFSLKRNPNGITDPGFFHKDAGGDAPEFVATKDIYSDSNDKTIHYILCNNKATLLYLANLGCIEMNPWFSRVQSLEHPDYLILDLDPSDKNTFEQVIETAKAIKEILDRAGAPAYLKTSGSSGLHIYVPLHAKYTYEQAKSFAEIVAAKTHDLVPDFTSLERSLKKRGDNVYIDYMQNNIAQTVAAPYSLRPKPFAPVATPLDWKELKSGLTIAQFNITNIFQRLEKKGDLFAGMLAKRIDMKKCLERLGG